MGNKCGARRQRGARPQRPWCHRSWGCFQLKRPGTARRGLVMPGQLTVSLRDQELQGLGVGSTKPEQSTDVARDTESLRAGLEPANWGSWARPDPGLRGSGACSCPALPRGCSWPPGQSQGRARLQSQHQGLQATTCLGQPQSQEGKGHRARLGPDLGSRFKSWLSMLTTRVRHSIGQDFGNAAEAVQVGLGLSLSFAMAGPILQEGTK